MQTTTRRLTLAREVLRPLGDDALRRARGGVTITTSFVLSCVVLDCVPQGTTGTFSCAKAGSCCCSTAEE